MAEGFTCEVDEQYRSACERLDFYGEHEGKRYCVLHFPSATKKRDPRFHNAIREKLEGGDFNFCGVVYFLAPSSVVKGYFLDFEYRRFGKQVNFSHAVFKEEPDFTEAVFEWGADFSSAIFEQGVQFQGATFEQEASFDQAIFNDSAVFNNVTFSKEASFRHATFEEVSFDSATYKDRASFIQATFKGIARFWSLRIYSSTFFEFWLTTTEKPEQVSFHSTHLRPSWFIDVVDAQKFDFSYVEWFRKPNGDALELQDEIDDLAAWWKFRRWDVSATGRLHGLHKACTRLMNNAEDNREYPTANAFHYWSMELLRREGLRRLGLIGALYWVYWALSGYGERPRRAFLILVGMWAVFAILYMVAGPLRVPSAAQFLLTILAQFILHIPLQLRVPSLSAIEHSIADIGSAFVYSLGALARLRPEPQPHGPSWFQFFVTAEGILGPLQIALLALAIRRQVMR